MNTKALAALIPFETAELKNVGAILPDKHPGRLRLTLECGIDLHLRGSLDLSILGLATRLVKVQGQFQVPQAKP